MKLTDSAGTTKTLIHWSTYEEEHTSALSTAVMLSIAAEQEMDREKSVFDATTHWALLEVAETKDVSFPKSQD